jgi:hypothetical protein
MANFKLEKVDCKYGAPMGRGDVNADPDRRGEAAEDDSHGKPGRWRLRHVGIDAQGYDNGGAYWGQRARGERLYMATADVTGVGVRLFLAARGRREAMGKVRCNYPRAIFWGEKLSPSPAVKVRRRRVYTPRRAGLRRWLAMAPDYVLDCFDNGGFGDRYTVMFCGEMLMGTDTTFAGTIVPYLGMSGAPTHPQGVSMWGELGAGQAAHYRAGNGRFRVKWMELPAEIREHVCARAAAAGMVDAKAV